jgi:sulfatase maturation enzyme AslB (radical SAM superfamily)
VNGLRSKEDHLKLSRLASNSGVKLVTFGLSERNVRLRKLDFINKKNIVANLDNDERKIGKGLWDIDTFPPSRLQEFMKDNDVTHIIIMSDEADSIGRQLDSFCVEYYSSVLITELKNIEIKRERDFINYDAVLMEVMKSISEPILRCCEMEAGIYFKSNAIMHCCGGSFWGYDAKICDFQGGAFPIEAFNRSFRDIVLQNISHTGGCVGCPSLKYGSPDIFRKGLSNVNIAISNKCQLRCKYCYIIDRQLTGNDEKPYPALPILNDLYSYGLLKADAYVNMSGGEPTIYKYFEETMNFCIENDISSKILTNAVTFSDITADLLTSDKRSMVIISPDAGTPETYKIVKGADCYDRVWENIRIYSQCGNVTLKYIITQDNMKAVELDAFMRNVAAVGVKKLIISAEAKNYGIKAQMDALPSPPLCISRIFGRCQTSL